MAIARFIIIFFLICDPVFAMDSSNYSIPKDVLNQTGGISSSDNYTIEHNLGESVIGTSSSGSYKESSGYLEPDLDVLIFTIDDNTVDLGLLSDSSVATANTILTVSTSSLKGYTVKAYDDTQVGIDYGLVDGDNNISDATTPNVFINNPAPGVEHYGLTVAGVHANTNYASGTKINSLNNTNLSDIGSYDNFIANDTLNIQYRASISNQTSAGANYRANPIYICTGNF